MHVLVHPPIGVGPGVTFHIEVPAPRLVGDRVEALHPRWSMFFPGHITEVRGGGAEFMIDWDDDIADTLVSAANIRDHQSAPRPHPVGRFEVTCPPGCTHPSSFVARIPDPAAQAQPPPLSVIKIHNRIIYNLKQAARRDSLGHILWVALPVTPRQVAMAQWLARHRCSLQRPDPCLQSSLWYTNRRCRRLSTTPCVLLSASMQGSPLCASTIGQVDNALVTSL